MTLVDLRITDAKALEQFEALVLSQQPASAPWRPVTDYSFEARKQIEGIHPQLICDWLVGCEDADILDYGCGPGHLVWLLREENARRRWQLGVDGYDITYPTSPPTQAAVYDLVICREVLEHCTVREIRDLVARLCAYSARLVYVTTRFAQSPQHLLSVDTSDGLDPTHITMLNQSFLRMLFVLEGFRRRADLEAKMDHKGYGRVLVYERV